LAAAIGMYQYKLKGVSFIPASSEVYAQMPYEEIDKETYNAMAKKIKPLDFSKTTKDAVAERFCDGDVCTLD